MVGIFEVLRNPCSLLDNISGKIEKVDSAFEVSSIGTCNANDMAGHNADEALVLSS